MGSSFFELNIGLTGLLAAQKGLSVTGNNITNVNTAGYSRQVITQKAEVALPAASKGMIGSGTQVVDVTRLRDFYLDMKYWNQNNIQAEYALKNQEMSQVSYLFNEPTDEGINSTLNSFFEKFQDLTTNSTDSTYFEAVKQSASELTNYLNTMATGLSNIQESANTDIESKVKQINSIATQIQRLNVQINKLEMSGTEASALRDERENLVDQLSGIVNVEIEEKELNPNLQNGVYNALDRSFSNKQYIVRINGQELVSHDQINQLTVEKYSTPLNSEDSTLVYNIKWATGLEFNEHSNSLSGELKALIDIRDGNGDNAFTGTITATDDNKLIVNNINRGDIQDTGSIQIGAGTYDYTSYTYDEVTGEIAFVMDDSIPVPLPFNVGAGVTVGKDVSYKGIPYYMNKLNEFARTLARAMNEGEYRDGSNIENMTGSVNSYTKSGETGMYIFSYTDENGNYIGQGDRLDYEKLTAKNISISADLDENASNIPISASENPSESQVDVIFEFASLNHASLFNEGELSDYMSAMMSQVSIDINQASKFERRQEDLVTYIENRRAATSGVQQNEEMTNLVKYQSAYRSAAKIINIMDQLYDVTINGLMN